MKMVGFWRKKTGNYLTHTDGLTQDQVDFLRTLEVGDRLILWDNDKKSFDKAPDLSLKYWKKDKETDND